MPGATEPRRGDRAGVRRHHVDAEITVLAGDYTEESGAGGRATPIRNRSLIDRGWTQNRYRAYAFGAFRPRIVGSLV